ncbi:copper amine oxidase N-terminal domain-containing protein [Thermohalobacter berrensis]|uniref:Copper amine oxidase-like N-terminal domain-containing protein n=1 Tax=Thermohalobacter berrensis TaxID=99594 RepID=A0A419SXW1_9FIRM|nr:copper amine oxidase N-terminal domain-containing protein [Thermohalobacter berrensis]RKD30103.1 hypothetical protein BET03_05200 [Thermohalobacter berrensis]
MKIKRIKFILVILLIVSISTTASFAEDFLKEIKVYFNNIKIEVDNKEVSTDTEPFIYNDRVYVPLRFVAEAMNAKVSWENEENKAIIKTFDDVEECDYLNGEVFVYGMITDIDYEKRKITLEQHYDDNSIEVTPLLEVKENVVIVLQRNDKKMNIKFKDLKIGDNIGLILDKNKKVRGIIISV